MGQIRVVNLEQGFPTRDEACKRLDQLLPQAKKAGTAALKIIHGYGSSGTGGILRFAIRAYLRQCKERGEIRAFIPGESWSQFDKYSKELLKHVPDSLLDSDLGRNNRGITLVLL
jgi:Smr domain-containing protein